MGVWIETYHQANDDIFLGHTLRGCVDWNREKVIIDFLISVTPYVGVWIETNFYYDTLEGHRVTPYVGVWIETDIVWQWREITQSHPTWVCGLKHHSSTSLGHRSRSHPTWVCGLKHNFIDINYGRPSHTLRGCVDWNNVNGSLSRLYNCHTLRGCVDWNMDV